jgi:hypothetical protein
MPSSLTFLRHKLKINPEVDDNFNLLGWVLYVSNRLAPKLLAVLKKPNFAFAAHGGAT